MRKSILAFVSPLVVGGCFDAVDYTNANVACYEGRCPDGQICGTDDVCYDEGTIADCLRPGSGKLCDGAGGGAGAETGGSGGTAGAGGFAGTGGSAGAGGSGGAAGGGTGGSGGSGASAGAGGSGGSGGDAGSGGSGASAGAGGAGGTGDPPADCDGDSGTIPHGESENRDVFKSATVPFGSECESETQSRVCDDGVFGAWSGSAEFSEASCVVLEQWPPASGILQLSERTGAYAVVDASGLSVAWLAMDESGTKVHAYWRTLLGPDATVVDLGETPMDAGSIAVAEKLVVAFVNTGGEACAGPAETAASACIGSGVKTVALSPNGGTLAYTTAAEVVLKHLASGAITTLPIAVSGRVALGSGGKEIAYASEGKVYFAAPPEGSRVLLDDGFGPSLGSNYVAFQSLSNSSMHGPPSPGSLVELIDTLEPTLSGDDTHIAYRADGTVEVPPATRTG